MTRVLVTENGFSNSDGKYTSAGIYNMYTNREPRFYVDVTYNGSTWLNTTSSSGTVITETYYSGNSGKKVGRNDYSPTGYIGRKNIAQSDANNSRSWVMLRLANVYLDYAEALNESSPGNPDIAKYVNLIRKGLVYLIYPRPCHRMLCAQPSAKKEEWNWLLKMRAILIHAAGKSPSKLMVAHFMEWILMRAIAFRILLFM